MQRWYALYTKPHQEHHVRGFLESRGLETYLPLARVRRNGRSRTEPFFACYCFARFDPVRHVPQIHWTPGLKRVVSFDGQLAAVPDEVVGAIQARLAEMEELIALGPRFHQGDRVTITAGPLKDFHAVFDQSLSSRDRARILVEFLGRRTPCEVSPEWLERVH